MGPASGGYGVSQPPLGKVKNVIEWTARADRYKGLQAAPGRSPDIRERKK
jgi:hypothetical protein